MPIQKLLFARILIILFLLQLSTSCIKEDFWEYDYCKGAKSLSELSSIHRQASSLEAGLVSLGFSRVNTTENEEKRFVKLNGEYKHITDLRVSITCFKQFTSPGKGGMEINVKSPNYPTNTSFGDGDELIQKIKRFLEAGAGEEAGGRPE